MTTSRYSASELADRNPGINSDVMGADEQLRIVTQRATRRLVLELHGELDMATSPQLSDALDELVEGGPATLVLDLRGVSFLDSTGLKAIFSARNASRDRGQQLAVTPGLTAGSAPAQPDPAGRAPDGDRDARRRPRLAAGGAADGAAQTS